MVLYKAEDIRFISPQFERRNQSNANKTMLTNSLIDLPTNSASSVLPVVNPKQTTNGSWSFGNLMDAVKNRNTGNIKQKPPLDKRNKRNSSKVFTWKINDADVNEDDIIMTSRKTKRQSMFRRRCSLPVISDNKNDSFCIQNKSEGFISSVQTLSAIATPLHQRSISAVSIDDMSRAHKDTLEAIQLNDCKKVKRLLKRTAYDFNVIDGFSLMNEAAYRGCKKCLKMFYKHGWSVNTVDALQWTPLHAAVFAQDLDVVRFLLSRNASVNIISYDGWSPLSLAVISGNLSIIDEMVQKNADPLLNKDGNLISPFQLAINLENNDVIDYFLKLGTLLVKK